MKTITRFRILAVAAATAAMLLAASPALAMSGHHGTSLTCTRGDIPSGDSEITVTGQCSVPAGATIEVRRSITVRRGAVLDAQSAPSTIVVRRNVVALPGSMLGLGCQPASYVGNSGHACTVDPTGHSTIRVHGDVVTLGAATVLINGATVDGSITALGGGSETPWAIKNNVVGRDITVAGQTTDWLGDMFNKVGGTTTLLFITITDTDPGGNGAYVVQNRIERNLICFGVTPKVSGGFSPTSVNVVGGHAFGQCAALV